MKKKTVKKLELSKETVRGLSREEMGRAAGGHTSSSQFWSIPEYSCQQDFDPLATSGC